MATIETQVQLDGSGLTMMILDAQKQVSYAALSAELSTCPDGATADEMRAFWAMKDAMNAAREAINTAADNASQFTRLRKAGYAGQAQAPAATLESTIEIPTSDQYEKNFDGTSRFYGPCVVCGKDVKVSKYWLIEVGGGGVAALPGSPEAEDVEDSGYMGEQPIGPDCLKKHPQLKPYVVTY